MQCNVSSYPRELDICPEKHLACQLPLRSLLSKPCTQLLALPSFPMYGNLQKLSCHDCKTNPSEFPTTVHCDNAIERIPLPVVNFCPSHLHLWKCCLRRKRHKQSSDTGLCDSMARAAQPTRQKRHRSAPRTMQISKGTE